MAEAQATIETTDTETMTPEEEAFFESGGEKELAPAAEAEPEPKAEEAAAAEPEAEDSNDNRARVVPHGALHAEREEHKKTRSELNELREWKGRMEERWKAFESTNQKPAEDEQPPDPNEDIFAFSQWQAKQLEKLNSRINERDQTEQQSRQQQELETRIWGQWETDARTYAQQNPDFEHAARYLSEARDKQLQAVAGYDQRFADVRMRNAQIEAELKNIVAAAAQQGRSSAELVYEIAKGYGYAPGAGQKQQAQHDPARETADKLDKLEKTQQANRSLGQVSGASGGDEVTPEALAGMSEAEFDRWLSDPKNAHRFQQMMGG